MRHLRLLPFGLVLLASCKEVGPIIDFTPKASDTAFSTTVETQQQRMVLIEEFTGVTCPTCPPGHKVLKDIEDSYPGRVAIIGIQPNGITQAKPYDHDGIKSKNDNRSTIGTTLANEIYSAITSIPQAGVDRVPVNGGLLSVRTEWKGAVNNRLSVPAKANVSVSSSYNADNRQAVIKVHIAYTTAVSANQSLTLALIEDNVVDAQELASGTPPVEPNYVHRHVLRDILTPAAGAAILQSMATKPAGQVYERTFVYTVPSTVLNLDNCHLVAYVCNNDGADKEVMQAAETHLK